MNKRIILILLCVVLAVLTIGVMAACDRKEGTGDNGKQFTNGELDGEYVQSSYPYLRMEEVEGAEAYILKIQGDKQTSYIKRFDIFQGEYVVEKWGDFGFWVDGFQPDVKDYYKGEKGIAEGPGYAFKKELIDDKHTIFQLSANLYDEVLDYVFEKNQDLSEEDFSVTVYYSDASMRTKEFKLSDMSVPFDTATVGKKVARIKGIDVDLKYEVVENKSKLSYLKENSNAICSMGGDYSFEYYNNVSFVRKNEKIGLLVVVRSNGVERHIGLYDAELKELIGDIDTSKTGVQTITVKIGNYVGKFDLVVYEKNEEVINYCKKKGLDKLQSIQHEFNNESYDGVYFSVYLPEINLNEVLAHRVHTLCIDEVAENPTAIKNEILKKLRGRVDDYNKKGEDGYSYSKELESDDMKVEIAKIYTTKKGYKMCDIVVKTNYEGKTLECEMTIYLYKSTDSGIIDIKCRRDYSDKDKFRITTYYENATQKEEYRAISEAEYDETIDCYIYNYQKDGKTHKKVFW